LGNRRAALSRLDLTGEKAGWELMWEGKNPPTDTRGFFEAVKWSRSSYEVGAVIEHAGPDARQRFKARTIVTSELRNDV